MTTDVLASVLQHFPNLLCLQYQDVSFLNSHVLSAIQRHYPRLQYLILASERVDHPDGVPDIEQKGLRGLHVYDGRKRAGQRRQLIAEDDMVDFLMKHAETLETITFESRFPFSAPKKLLKKGTAEQVTFKRLRRRCYVHHSISEFRPFLLWIMQHAPYLESLHTVQDERQTRVMHDLLSPTRQQYLKSIGLVAGSSLPYESEQQFIQHHIQLGHNSNLTKSAINSAFVILQIPGCS